MAVRAILLLTAAAYATMAAHAPPAADGITDTTIAMGVEAAVAVAGRQACPRPRPSVF